MTSSTSTVRSVSVGVPSLAVLVLLCAVQFMDALDLSVVGIALPAIQSSFNMTAGALQWVVSAYVLGYGGFLLIGGRTADIVGRKRMLLIASAVFLAVTLAIIFAPNAGWLLALRFVKGVAAGFSAPAALALITSLWPEGHARARALGIFGATNAVGYCVGVVVGGLLTSVDWRLVFVAPLPVVVYVLIVAPKLLPADRPHPVRPRLDVLGAVAVTLGVSALVFALTLGPDAGWAAPVTLVAFVIAAVALAAFPVIERRHREPMLDLGLLRHRFVRNGNFVGFTLNGAYVAFQFLATLYMQTVLGWSPFETALAFLPPGILIAVIAPLAGRLNQRFGTSRMLLVGVAVLVAAYALFLRVKVDSSYVGGILPTMLLIGVAAGILFTTSNIAAVSGVSERNLGSAGGLFITTFQLGGAVVLAVATAVFAGAMDTGWMAPVDEYVWATGFIAVLVAACFVFLAVEQVVHHNGSKRAVR